MTVRDGIFGWNNVPVEGEATDSPMFGPTEVTAEDAVETKVVAQYAEVEAEGDAETEATAEDAVEAEVVAEDAEVEAEGDAETEATAEDAVEAEVVAEDAEVEAEGDAEDAEVDAE